MAEWAYKDALEHMGRKVLVTHILEKAPRSNETDWLPRALEEPRVGWIAGCRTLRNGVYTLAKPRSPFDDYNDPPSFNTTGTVFAVMVVFWPTERPRPAHPNGISFDTQGSEPYTTAGFGEGKQRRKWIEDHKKLVQKGEYPRDERGRFKKYSFSFFEEG